MKYKSKSNPKNLLRSSTLRNSTKWRWWFCLVKYFVIDIVCWYDNSWIDRLIDEQEVDQKILQSSFPPFPFGFLSVFDAYFYFYFYFFFISYFCLLNSSSIFDITSKLLTIMPEWPFVVGFFIEPVALALSTSSFDTTDLVSAKLPFTLFSGDV